MDILQAMSNQYGGQGMGDDDMSQRYGNDAYAEMNQLGPKYNRPARTESLGSAGADRGAVNADINEGAQDGGIDPELLKIIAILRGMSGQYGGGQMYAPNSPNDQMMADRYGTGAPYGNENFPARALSLRSLRGQR